MARRQSTLVRVLDLVRPYRWKLAQSLGLLLMLTGAGLATPLIAAQIIGVALPSQDWSTFRLLLGAMFLLLVVTAVLRLLNNHNMRCIGGRIVFDLRRKLYKHLHCLSLNYFESRGSGEIMSRLMNDVAAITSLVTGTALNTIISLFTAVAILGLLFYLNWTVALLAVVVLPLHYFGYYLFRKRLSYQSWKQSEKISQVYGKANEVFDAAKIVKAYSNETREVRTLTAQLREGYQINVHSGLLSNAWGLSSGLISNGGMILVMLVCGFAVVFGNHANTMVAVKQYIVLTSYVTMLYAPIDQLIDVANQLIPAKVGMMRVFEILDMEPEVQDRPSSVRRALQGRVEFESVCFAYPNGKQVLRDLNFTARPGQVVALVGPSGSGKTTIANLIARFYDRTAGAIRIDGVDIQDYALAALRNQMSMVLQETHLFRGTVRENLLYGKQGAGEDEVMRAASQASADQFIRALPDGYDTIIGSRGARLSGGQRQRLAIARALIRDPKILILDEATSALDTASEAKVKEALDHLMADRTTFIIAHRLSTIQNADVILVLDNGKIVQSGSHDRLMGQDGLYRKLYDPKWAKQKEQRDEQELRELAEEARLQHVG